MRTHFFIQLEQCPQSLPHCLWRGLSIFVGLKDNRCKRKGYCRRTCYQGENFWISNRAAPAASWMYTSCHCSPYTGLEEGHSWQDLCFQVCLKTAVLKTEILWQRLSSFVSDAFNTVTVWVKKEQWVWSTSCHVIIVNLYYCRDAF